MAGRSRIPLPHHQLHDPALFPRGPPRPHLLDDMGEVGPPFGGPRGGVGGLHPFPPPSRIIEERLNIQHQEIQALLVDNQRLAATHVALKQEVAAAQHELQRLSHAVGNVQAERDAEMREIYEKSMKMEADLGAVDAMRVELVQIRGDIQKLSAARQDLTGQVQTLTQDLNKAIADLQKAPAIKSEIEYMKQELQQAKQAIEYEKKGYAENYEQGQVMEKNLISMAREVEKLRAEVANAEKRARAAAAAGNQGSAAAGYGVSYANPDPNYGGNPYPAAYTMNPKVPGTADGGPQHAAGAGAGSVPGYSSWGSYDMQRSHVRR